MTINEIIFSMHPAINVRIYNLEEIDLIFEGTVDELIFNEEIDKEIKIVSLWISEQGYVKLYINEK